jgi:uncharacterized protein YozE (UPF0346 family)
VAEVVARLKNVPYSEHGTDGWPIRTLDDIEVLVRKISSKAYQAGIDTGTKSERAYQKTQNFSKAEIRRAIRDTPNGPEDVVDLSMFEVNTIEDVKRELTMISGRARASGANSAAAIPLDDIRDVLNGLPEGGDYGPQLVKDKVSLRSFLMSLVNRRFYAGVEVGHEEERKAGRKPNFAEIVAVLSEMPYSDDVPAEVMKSMRDVAAQIRRLIDRAYTTGANDESKLRIKRVNESIVEIRAALAKLPYAGLVNPSDAKTFHEITQFIERLAGFQTEMQNEHSVLETKYNRLHRKIDELANGEDHA